MESVSTGRRLNPRSESIDHFRTCREDFGIERNQSFKGDQGNAQFSLCCTSTAMPDDESQESTSGISFVPKNRIRKAGTQEREKLLGLRLGYTLLLNPRDMSGGNTRSSAATSASRNALHASRSNCSTSC